MQRWKGISHSKIARGGKGVPVSSSGIMHHTFYAHSKEDCEKIGLKVTPYGKNSALIKTEFIGDYRHPDHPGCLFLCLLFKREYINLAWIL